MMKRYVLSSLAILWVALSAAVFAEKSHAGTPIDGIVAIVNDSVITESELTEAMAQIQKQYNNNSNAAAPTGEALRKQVLDQLINRKLQIDLAERAGLKLTDADIDKAIGTIAKQNNVSVEELYGKVKETGMDKKAYRKEIREEIILQQVQQDQVSSKIKVSDQEVNDYLRSAMWKNYNSKEYHIQDILIGLPEAPSSQDIMAAKQHADEVLTKLHNGMSFTEAALNDSSNSQALQGGDLGWRKLPEIPEMFASEIVRMKVNDVAGPILTPNGFHIIKLADVRNSTLAGSDQQKQIRQFIFQRKFEEALQSWITKLRSESYINLTPGKV